MATPLEAIFAAIQAYPPLAAITAPNVNGGTHAIQFGWGQIPVKEHSRPPRVVWIPQSGAIQPARGAGGNPRPLWTRRLTVLADIWAATPEQADLLITLIGQALRRQLSTSARPISEEWPTGSRAKLALGHKVTLTISVDVPLTDAVAPTATLTTHDQNGNGSAPWAVSGDGKLDTGES